MFLKIKLSHGLFILILHSDDEVFRTLPSKDPLKRYDFVKTIDRRLRRRAALRKSSSRRGEAHRQFAGVLAASGEHTDGIDDHEDLEVNSKEEKRRRLESVKALTGSLDNKRQARSVQFIHHIKIYFLAKFLCELFYFFNSLNFLMLQILGVTLY